MRRLLHRYIWQRLPYGMRRAAFFAGSALLAPRPTPDARARKPVIVAGTLRTASGLGESARLCYLALESAGLPVLAIDLTAAMQQPEDAPDFAFADGRAHVGPGTIILHINGPLIPLAMLRLGRRVIHHKRIVGYWAWELMRLPADWRHGLPFVHEIWAPSRFTAEAIAPLAQGRPVRVVPHPVAVTHVQGYSSPRSPDRPFTALVILNMASSFARKNPCAAIEAFRRAFGDEVGARLIVKCANAASFQHGLQLIEEAARGAENIRILIDTMTVSGIAALYDQADVVVSLHRAEGFGLIMAEAMLRGLPVVATDWSGNVDFLSLETGIPVPCRLIPAEDPQATYHHPNMSWADADIDAAARALRQLRDDPQLAARLGQNAAHFAQHTWSAQAYASNVRRHLQL